MSEQTALAARIRGYLAELEKVVDRAILLSKKALKSGDDGYWDGVALNLHSFYSGTERIFEDIARTMDGNIPSGFDCISVYWFRWRPNQQSVDRLSFRMGSEML
jgi:hypothetical protein